MILQRLRRAVENFHRWVQNFLVLRWPDVAELNGKRLQNHLRVGSGEILRDFLEISASSNFIFRTGLTSQLPTDRKCSLDKTLLVYDISGAKHFENACNNLSLTSCV